MICHHIYNFNLHPRSQMGISTLSVDPIKMIPSKTKQWFVKQRDWKRHLLQALFCGEMIQLKVYFNNSDLQEDEFRILFLEVFYSISGCYHSFNLWSIQPVEILTKTSEITHLTHRDKNHISNIRYFAQYLLLSLVGNMGREKQGRRT